MRHRLHKQGLAAFAVGLLLFAVGGCQSAQIVRDTAGRTGAYAEIDLVRLQSDAPPPLSNRETDRFFQENYR